MIASLRRYPLASLFTLSLAPLAGGLLAASVVQAADTQTRTVGPQKNGSIVASDNQLLTPAGITVQLGSPIVAKAVAVNPNRRTRSGAVLTVTGKAPIIVFNTATGAVLQQFIPGTVSGTTFTQNAAGSFTGITYSADGSKLLFSQDGASTSYTSPGFVAVADVDPFTGLLTPAESIALPPPPANPNLYNPYSANSAGLAVLDNSIGLVAEFAE